MGIYLNNAATSWPKAPGVPALVAEVLNNPPHHPGRSTSRSNDWPAQCRERLAQLLQVQDPQRIVLTSNATHALNLACLGLDWRAGDLVVTTVTEHNSVLRPLNRLVELSGIRVEWVDLTPEGELDLTQYAALLEQAPKLVAVNHASNVTGRIAPVTAMFAQAHSAGALTLLDASQSLGHLAVQPDVLHADLVAFTGHKGLHGPPGTGGLYVAPLLELTQVVVGGTGVRSDLALHPPEMPVRLEAGTPDLPALAGLAQALDWVLSRDQAWLTAEQAAAQALYDGLASSAGIQVTDASPAVERTPLVSFTFERWNAEDAAQILEEVYGICCRSGLHCAPLIHRALGTAPLGTLRFSPSGFTTLGEIEQALAAVRQVAGQT